MTSKPDTTQDAKTMMNSRMNDFVIDVESLKSISLMDVEGPPTMSDKFNETEVRLRRESFYMAVEDDE